MRCSPAVSAFYHHDVDFDTNANSRPLHDGCHKFYRQRPQCDLLPVLVPHKASITITVVIIVVVVTIVSQVDRNSRCYRASFASTDQSITKLIDSIGPNYMLVHYPGILLTPYYAKRLASLRILVCWMVGWLIGWLVGLLEISAIANFNCVTSRLVGWLTSTCLRA